MNVMPDVVLDRLQLELHLMPELQVERSERLVQQKHARLVDERARKSDALLLATGELPGLPGLEAMEVDEREDLANAPGKLLSLEPLSAHPECDVLEDREVREERIGLEHGVDVPLVGRQADHVSVAEIDRAGSRLLEAADHPQGRRLAAAGGAEQREELPRLDRERDVVDGGDVVEALRDAFEPDVRRLSGMRRLHPLRDTHQGQSIFAMTCLICV